MKTLCPSCLGSKTIGRIVRGAPRDDRPCPKCNGSGFVGEPGDRPYPACCTAAVCQRLDCSGCPNLPALESFQLWVRATQAKPSDAVVYYRATREPEPEGGKS